MTLTQADVENVSFAIAKKGYDVDEVDEFLEKVADEIGQMTATIASLREQLSEEKPNTEKKTTPSHGIEPEEGEYDEIEDEEARVIIAEKDELIDQLRKDLDSKNADDSAISQALIVAQRSADEIIAKANTQADNTISDAKDEASRIVSRAEAEKEGIMAAIAKLEEEREASRNGYADVLRDFIEDANTKLNNLGFDDDVSAIPYDSIASSAAHTPSSNSAAKEDDLGKTTMADPIGIVDKDMSGFGELAGDDDELD